MDCYAGKWAVEVMPHEPFLDEKKTIVHMEQPGMFLQFVEGCGYTVFNLTPNEAESLAKILVQGAKATRKAFNA